MGMIPVWNHTHFFLFPVSFILQIEAKYIRALLSLFLDQASRLMLYDAVMQYIQES